MISDRKKYLGLQAELRSLLAQFGATALNQPEYRAAWKASETIKNRHGGFPPAPEPEEAEEPIRESREVTREMAT